MTDSVAEIKGRLNIEDLVAEYVVLKRIGKSLKGLCPFHSEKTPSFIVSPDKGIAYCFGCHKGGDLFKFLMEVENVDFAEALKILAEKTGVVIENQSEKNFVKKGEKEILIDIHEEAADFFVEQLWNSPEGLKSLEYLRNRGLTDETIKRFKLGFAPDSYELTHRMLLKKNFKTAEILQSGLALAKDTSMGNVYDRFRGRLMFPVQDSLGRVVGFGGRATMSGQEPKYLNSPETVIYQKNQLLYGFYQAKTAIKKTQMAVIVEGYMDFLAAFQDGMEQAVAVNGTALSKRHLTLLKPYVKDLVFAFDMDNAGQEASKRSFEVTQDFEFTVKVLTLPSGKDIAEFVQNKQGNLMELLGNTRLFTDYFYADLLMKNDPSILTNKKKILAEFAGFFMKLKSSVEKDVYVRRLALDLGVPEIQIYDELNMMKLSKNHPAKMALETAMKPLNYGLEEILIGLIGQFPACFFETKCELTQAYFSDNLKYIYNQFTTKYNPQGTQQDAVLELDKDTPEEWKSKLALLSLYVEEKYGSMTPAQITQEMITLVQKIKMEQLIKARTALQKQLKEAENTHDNAKMEKLLTQMNALNRGN